MDIQTSKTGGIISYNSNDWLYGLIPNFSTDSSVYFDTTSVKGLAYMKDVNVWRKPGYLLPGFERAIAINLKEVDGILRNAISYGGYNYATGGTKLQKFTINNVLFNEEAFTNFPHTISRHDGHGGVTSLDLVTYDINVSSSRVKRLLYSWTDGTDGDIGIYDDDDFEATFNDDWLSTVVSGGAVLNSSTHHPLIIGADDELYVGNGRYLGQIQGATGANCTYNSAKLTLPADFTITSFAKVSNYLVIFAYKGSQNPEYRSEATAFFWDYVSEDPTYVIPLQGNYVNGGFSWKGTVGCFVEGRSSNPNAPIQTKLLYYNGSTFETLKEIDGSVPGNGGVDVVDNVIFFNSSGNIYQYGSPYKGYDDNLTLIGTGPYGNDGGMLKNLYSSRLYFSDLGLEMLSTNYSPNAQFVTPLLYPPFPDDYIGQIKKVRINWGSLTSNPGNAFSLFLNKGTGRDVKIVETKSVSKLSSTYFYDSVGGVFPKFTKLGIFGVWSLGSGGTPSTFVPPHIKSVEVYFDFIKE